MGVAAIAAIASISGAGLQAYGTYEGFKAAESEAEFGAQISRSNVKIIEQQQRDLEVIGAQTIAKLKTESIQTAADQVVGFASTGIDVASAVVGETIEETAIVSSADILAAQKNFERQQWGLEISKMNEITEAVFQEAQARRLRQLAPIATVASLLGTAKQTIPAGASLLG